MEVEAARASAAAQARVFREFVDDKTSMITEEAPLLGLLCCNDLGFLHVEIFDHGPEVEAARAHAAAQAP